MVGASASNGFGSSAHLSAQNRIGRGCGDLRSDALGGSERSRTDLGAVWVGGADEQPPKKLDAAILFAPVGSLVPPALKALDRGGVLVIAGIHLSDVPPLNYEEDLFYERVVRSVTANTRADGEELLRLAPRIARARDHDHVPVRACPRCTQRPCARQGQRLGGARHREVMAAGASVGRASSSQM